MSTAVTDRLNVTLADAKLHLRVDHNDEDTLIQDFIDSAKASADRYLNNPFTDRDGSPLPMPIVIKTWVLRRVTFLYEQRVENLRADTVPGAGTIDYGARTGDAAGSVDYALIQPWRLNPGL